MEEAGAEARGREENRETRTKRERRERQRREEGAKSHGTRRGFSLQLLEARRARPTPLGQLFGQRVRSTMSGGYSQFVPSSDLS